MIDVWVDGGRRWVGRALNEAVVDRSESGRAVEISVRIGRRDFITFLADALIIATPTGSTAYSLSAGGPIVEPGLKTLLLTPVAAHTVFNRPLVLDAKTVVELTVEGHRSAVVSLDGRQVLELQPGQGVWCQASDVEACFLVRGDRDFHSVLKEKFGLAGR
jgi:NAD+ kinase